MSLALVPRFILIGRSTNSALVGTSLFRLSVIFLLMLVSKIGNAQTKHTEYFQQVWLGYFNQTRFSNKFGTWTDLHLRTNDFFEELSQTIIRLGLTYYVNNDAKLTAGYAYVTHYPADNHENVSVPEHRPWQQIQWHTRYPKLKLMQWFRMEERWRRKIKDDEELADGYNFNYRLRYNILSQFPLSKKRFQKGTLAFVVSNEVFVNFGKQVVNNYFDQNRFFAGFHYYINQHDQLQFGYMNVFQQLAAGNQYKSVSAGRIFFFH